MHDVLGVVHNDLTMSNVVFATPVAKEDTALPTMKLVDFGCAKVYEKNELNQELVAKIKKFDQHLNKNTKSPNEFCGTSNFVSPEYIESTRAHINNDVWAIGVLTFYLLTGEYPFEDKSEYLTFQRILNLEYELPKVS